MPSQWAILRVRATVIAAIREWFEQNGFINMDTPILTPAAVEGTTTLFETEYFDEGKAYLSQSGQLYNEADIMAFGKVYCFGPTFRAEKSKTRRHLTEFWMIEPEIAFCDLEQLMEVEEQFVTHILKRVLRDRGPELDPSAVTFPSWKRSSLPSRASHTMRPSKSSTNYTKKRLTRKRRNCSNSNGAWILVRLTRPN